jgi:AmmeMemoRadiSam system protein B
MTAWPRPGSVTAAIRPPAVAGAFYPAQPELLAALVDELLVAAARPELGLEPGIGQLGRPLAGLLLPHAGLVYSGVVAAAGMRLAGAIPTGTQARNPPDARPTIVILGTNHGAGWLTDVASWGLGAWRTPLGDVEIDDELSAAILDLGPPFVLDREAHGGEHSIEVQLPLIQVAFPTARIVPLSVATGTGDRAIVAGARLGELLAERRAVGAGVLLVISSDMAHYPANQACRWATDTLLPVILDRDPAALAAAERAIVDGGTRGLVCGMCGIEPAVLGLAALGALGATHAVRLAAATSADAGGPADRTVGYLAVAFTA